MHILFLTLLIDLKNMVLPQNEILCQTIPYCKKSHSIRNSIKGHKTSFKIIVDKEWENPLKICSGVRQLLVDTHTINVANRYYKSNFERVNFYKWTMVRNTQFNIIVYMDMDIDFENLDVSNIEMNLLTFYNSNYTSVATNDWAVPFNAGIFAIKPDIEIYNRGCTLVSSGIFNTSTGFNNIGHPVSFIENNIDKRFLNCRMIRQNTWHVVSGDSDQGLFSLFYVLQGNPQYAKNMKVGHFWWKYKPYLQCKRWIKDLLHMNESFCFNTITNWLNTSSSICRKNFQYFL